jgi:hypothetical protein
MDNGQWIMRGRIARIRDEFSLTNFHEGDNRITEGKAESLG